MNLGAVDQRAKPLALGFKTRRLRRVVVRDLDRSVAAAGAGEITSRRIADRAAAGPLGFHSPSVADETGSHRREHQRGAGRGRATRRDPDPRVARLGSAPGVSASRCRVWQDRPSALGTRRGVADLRLSAMRREWPGARECCGGAEADVADAAQLRERGRRGGFVAYLNEEDRMADPIAVIIRFRGDPDDLFERFERARRMWIQVQDGDYERPAFYAACKTDEGIAIVNVWQTAVAHRAFGQPLHSHIDAVGMGAPDQIERMRITKLGWD